MQVSQDRDLYEFYFQWTKWYTVDTMQKGEYFRLICKYALHNKKAEKPPIDIMARRSQVKTCSPPYN
jgi:hypothetical protein